MKNRLMLLFVFVFILSFGFSSLSAQNHSTLTIFAAASLTDAFTQIGEAFKATHPGLGIVFNFAGSSDLATQLVEGAPADVFASANARQMAAAQDAGRIGGRPRIFARNRLVLIVPADNPAGITTLRDLSNDGIRLIIAAPGVPVRDYTDTMLRRLASDPAYGEQYEAAFLANVVSEEPNVRQVTAKVALGEADAGIVYISDVTPNIAGQVLMIAIPDHLNTIAGYPIAVTGDAANPDLARAFVDYVLSDAGQDVLVAWNFISVRIPEVPYSITLPEGDSAVTITGQVLNPLTLTVDDLRDNFSSHTLDVTYRSGEDTVSTSFTGVPLWQVISAAQPNLDVDVPNDRVSMFIVVTGSDGYQAVISWGEIDPEFAGQPILLAYEQDGAPITDNLGLIRLIVPSDAHNGRSVSGVVNISLFDAPPVTS